MQWTLLSMQNLLVLQILATMMMTVTMICFSDRNDVESRSQRRNDESIQAL